MNDDDSDEDDDDNVDDSGATLMMVLNDVVSTIIFFSEITKHRIPKDFVCSPRLTLPLHLCGGQCQT